MTQDEIVAMWKSAGDLEVLGMPYSKIEAFAKLVAAKKDAEHKEAMRWDVHTCGPTCKRYACVATREAVAAEREACAQVAFSWNTAMTDKVAAEIRARGQS